MRTDRLRTILLCVCALLLAGGVACASGAPSREELLERPAAGVVAGSNVNVRDRPSTRGKSLGRLGEDGYWEELVVVDAAPGDDGQIWYKILSEKLGEGWMHGRFLRFEGLDDPLGRFFVLLRRDFGTNPAMTQQRLGKPVKIERKTFRPEDYPENVTSVELRYPGGSVVFWIMRKIPFLVGADFEKGAAFGPISFGDGPEKVERLLGEPHGVRNRVWTYHSGMRRVHIGFGLGPNGEAAANRLIFERDAF